MNSPDPDLKSLFCEALERPGGPERDAYLEDACRGNQALKAGVEELLAAHDQADRFLAQGPTGPVAGGPKTLAATGTDALSIATNRAETTAAETHESARTSASETLGFAENSSDATNAAAVDSGRKNRPDGFVPGQVIALRYTLRNVLGEGGLGTVYLAEQSEPVKRQVALKLIKLGMDSRAVLARFDAERQALALMDHPNIARVYDGGTTETGQPFFVMELVNGLPITDYCDRKRLPVRARLELFVAVCQAVQHAHQKGIIHRDLKPSNVMVTEVDGRPTPKVIDFGVAKATEFDLTDQSLGDTGAIVGTPTYMSPEQANPSSMDIDTRTDIYALGVILYELLAGSPPLDASQFKRGALLEMLRMVREVDPPRPSTKVSTAEGLPNIAAGRSIVPAQLKRALTGDLDWIVMKALEKDRTRRYETANGFAADINRHLSSEPVLAAPPSRAYRTKKFVRKHRNGVLAASLVLLSLLGGLAAVAVVQTAANARLALSLTRETKANMALNEANGQLTKSRVAVEARYKLATDAIKTFHTGVSEDFLLKEEKFKELRNRLLKSASDFYGKLGSLLGKDTDIASRRALAQSNFELADLTGKVGRNEDALATHRAVLAAREALAAEPAAGALATVDIGRSLIAVAGLLEATGKTDEALASYRRSESLLAGLAGADPSARAALAACRSKLGYLLKATGKSDDALAAWRLAQADQEALAAALEASNDARHDLADTIYGIGTLLADIGKPSEAEAEHRRALALYQQLADGSPAVTQFRSDLASSHNEVGLRLSITGKPAEAAAEFRKALALWQKLADDNPAVTGFRSSVAGTHNDLAYLSTWGKPAEAEAEYRSALQIQQKLADDNPAVTGFRSSLASSHHDLGFLLSRTGKPAKAEAELRNALALHQKLADDNPAVTGFRFSLAHSHYFLGHWLSGTGKPAEAAAEYRTALALYQKLADDEPAVTPFRFSLALTHFHHGGLLRNTGKLAEAESEYRKAMALYQKLADDDPAVTRNRSDLAWSHRALADLLSKTGKPVEAEAEYRTALALWQKLADYRSTLADSHFNLGILLLNGGKPAEAEAEYRKAQAIRQKLVDDNPSDIDLRDGLAGDYLRVAARQAWFGQDKELSSTCEKLLSLAKDTEHPGLADKAAKCCSLRQAGPKRCEAALVLARRAVEHGKGSQWLAYFEMALGMAEYRSGHFAEADAALTAAMNDPGKNDAVSSTSAFYRAMGLFRQGKTDLARKLATEAAAKMRPLPVDEQKPLLGGADENDLIMWLAYKEAKPMIQFDATPAAPKPPNGK
jgi:eukaryotic-like serine/threonine-protein kinase